MSQKKKLNFDFTLHIFNTTEDFELTLGNNVEAQCVTVQKTASDPHKMLHYSTQNVWLNLTISHRAKQ